MRKAEKRRLGAIKFEQDMAEVRARGLKMQEHDRKQREKTLKDAAIAREKKSSKAEPGKSKTAQEKRERVAERLEEQDRAAVAAAILVTTGIALMDIPSQHPDETIDLMRNSEWEEMNSYVERDVELTRNLWNQQNPSMGKPMISRSPSKEFIADLNASYGKVRPE